MPAGSSPARPDASPRVARLKTANPTTGVPGTPSRAHRINSLRVSKRTCLTAVWP
jgi:hypothetical protein